MQTPYRKPGKYANLKSDPLITKGKFDELQKELEKLKKAKPAAVAETARLADLGDFSENAGYQFAKGRLRGINRRILELESQLDHAEIIKTQQQTDTVEIGHSVTVEFNNKQKTFQILGSAETDPTTGIISQHSPLGVALIGSAVGDKVKVKSGDREIEYKIIKIE
ncbi:MAG: hypothetical protein A3J93_00095 [Candidatus Magasanikbacteria bacterium RIFOXYC2_FULL_42_28]|uniref:Transcription elongation factor GreA n=1 Tax=Candidatus Magasanikbacteria bacterium RIFOXYC2_FULL_42_28 TaxID=1798704 RepID=A0A1F6NWE3_9BACT|nr:MAG: hypothetical protein A3J93_00095 [Candidatus Magasanikbacteria bacterium RIFOXYC2_FULL_42_28]